MRFNADASGVNSALAGVTRQIDGLKEEMAGLSWPDFAMGAEAVIGLLGRAAERLVACLKLWLPPLRRWSSTWRASRPCSALLPTCSSSRTTPPHRDRRRGEVRRSDCQAPLPHHARARQPHREAWQPLGTRAGGLLRPCGNTRQTPLDGALIKPIMITVCADADDDGDADG